MQILLAITQTGNTLTQSIAEERNTIISKLGLWMERRLGWERFHGWCD
nr:unnamed protein product [Callosobruchus analis]